MRCRITIYATVIVGAALVGASVLLVQLQRESLTDNVDATIRLRVADLASGLAAGASPNAITASDDEIALVQVLDASGQIVGESPNIRGLPPAIDEQPAPGKTLTRRKVDLALDDGPFRVIARTVPTPSGTYTVVVAGSLEDVDESIASLTGLLRVGIPLLLLVVGGGAWMLVGRALSPVESIRREVAEIGAGDLSRRVPQSNANDEIARLAATMNEMLGRIEAAYARQDEFVADAAHELRSPLASMRAQLEVDFADLPDARAANAAAELHAEVQRMQRLTDDLLLLARNGSERVARTELVDLDDLVLEESRRIRVGSAIEIVTTDVSAAQVRGDAAQLDRAIRNVLENAVRYARSHVALELSEYNDMAVLAVTDDGPGIPPGDRERVFERFSRVDTGRGRADGGAGLGLAITRTIVEAHGGSVVIDDTQTGGAQVVIRIPTATARSTTSHSRPTA